MRVVSCETCPIKSQEDIVRVRQFTRTLAVSAGFNLVEQTKIVTASSELARNTLIYGLGGTASIERVENDSKQGLRLTFVDNGPGIADIGLAMKDGYTSGSGLGHGLGGAKRLTHEFEIESTVGQGTRIVMTRWRGC